MIERDPPYGLAEFLAERRRAEGVRGRWLEGVERDAVVLGYLTTLAAEDGTTRVTMSTVAKHLRVRLGSSSQVAAERAVSQAIRQLVKYGAVEEVDPIKNRQYGRKYRADFEERRGELRIVSELRARWPDPLRRVRDLRESR